jgi:acyl-CoA thioesterase-1
VNASEYSFQKRRHSAMGSRLAIVLCAWIGLSAFTMATDTSSSTGTGKVLLVLGDSLAAGYGLDPAEAFPALLQEKADAAGFPCKVVNAGVSGDTTAGGLRRLDWLLRQKIDILLIELGGNDGLRGIAPETTKANLQAIIDRTRTKYPAVQIVIAGIRMPPNMGAEYADQFQKMYPALAEINRAVLVPFLLEGVGGSTTLNQEDRIHPTAAGQKIVADNVWRVLKPLLTSQHTESGRTKAARADRSE